MTTCDVCGRDASTFTCTGCSGSFCADHRLPENHDCHALTDSGTFVDLDDARAASTDDTGPEPMSSDDITTYGTPPGEDLESSPDVNPDGSMKRPDTDEVEGEKPAPSLLDRLRSRLRL